MKRAHESLLWLTAAINEVVLLRWLATGFLVGR